MILNLARLGVEVLNLLEIPEGDSEKLLGKITEAANRARMLRTKVESDGGAPVFVLRNLPDGWWDLPHDVEDHGNLLQQGGKIMDVGVDCNSYTPLSIHQVANLMAERPVVAYDHHKPV